MAIGMFFSLVKTTTGELRIGKTDGGGGGGCYEDGDYFHGEGENNMGRGRSCVRVDKNIYEHLNDCLWLSVLFENGECEIVVCCILS